jgi:hypothetical protein
LEQKLGKTEIKNKKCVCKLNKELFLPRIETLSPHPKFSSTKKTGLGMKL